jgi:asparagine synthase (glutamine-hydrolysing)
VCGIGGILRAWPVGTNPPLPHESIPEAWLDTIDEAIKHRGPDGQGRFRDRAVRADGSVVDVALVHRRLAIIDPACGQQPMVSERGRSEAEGLVAVVFNGCIYNHRELRRELEANGHRFVTDHSDTEVLIHGWREWGLGRFNNGEHNNVREGGLASRLEGMFAAAIWDRAAGQLTLLRDSCGEKPLYVTPTDAGTRVWAFASTAAGVYRVTPAGGRPAADGVMRWLHQGYDAFNPMEVEPRYTFTLPAELSVTDRSFCSYLVPRSEVESWELGAPMFLRTHELTLEEAERALVAGVERRLEADVRLGCFLSGGIDSGLIAAIARRALGSLDTFTLRMPVPEYDESGPAAVTARHLGTTHHTLDCEPRPAEDLLALIPQLGLPFGDSSLLPTTWISRAARGHVTTVLTGDGGDELFGGYERHMIAPALARAKLPLALIPARMLDEPDPRARRTKLARLARAARGHGYPDLTAIFPSSLLRGLVVREPEDWDIIPRPLLWLLSSRFGAIEEAMDWDTDYYLPGDLMRKADTATMSVALEARAPFLDRDLYAAARTATARSLLPGVQRKGLLRALARKYLPPEIVDRPKQGFAIPIGEWFRSDYGQMKQLLLDHLNAAEPWPGIGVELDRRFVRQLVDEHMGDERDHSQRLYMLLVLSIWAKSLK